MAQTLSVVIPAYNEESSIRAGKLILVKRWLHQQSWDTELIVVDDGSHDQTPELARRTADQVLHIAHKGKAAAVITGLYAAQMDLVMFTDMDQATPISEAGWLVDALQKGADVAIGSRGMLRQGAPAGRYLLSLGHMVLHKLLLGLRLDDTQCGFKAFRREVALDVLEHLVVYDIDALDTIEFPSVSSGFDTEFLFVAQRLGYRIREVPVSWYYQETRRVDLSRDAFAGVLDLLKIMLGRFRHHYPRPGSREKETEIRSSP